jgi:hypothetical protein
MATKSFHQMIYARKRRPFLSTIYDLWALTLLAVLLLASSELASQENPNEPKPMHFDITPLIGYRTSITFPTANSVFAEKPSYGFAAGVRLNEEDLVEMRWARQSSDIRFSDASVPREKVVLDQVHLDCTHEFIMDNWPIWIRPYIIGSAGGTHIRGGGNSAFTGFSLGLGTGLKVYFSRHIGLRFQVEWLPIVNSTEGAFACGVGCIVHLHANGVSQGEILAGPVFRF